MVNLVAVTIEADEDDCVNICIKGCVCARCGNAAGDLIDDCGHYYGNSAFWNGPNARDKWDGQMLCDSCWDWTGSRTGER